MKFTTKHIATAVLALASVAAHAADEDILVARPGGATFTGSGSLTFSADLLGALDTGKIAVTAAAPATGTITKDSDGYFTEITVGAPMSTLTLNTSTFQVLGVGTKGGATMVAPVVKSVSSGGSLTVTDINADLATKTIYATIIGGNGVGTLTNFALWNFTSITGDGIVAGSSLPKYTGPGVYNDTISGLTITADGQAKFAQALGLLSLGKAALTGITDYGTIKSTINATLDITPSIPEPSTYALMGLGLVGVALTARRNKAAA